MAAINEAVKKGPLMTMTLECETGFPKALKTLMVSLGTLGEAGYKGFLVMDEGEEYWWVQLHLYKNKGHNQLKKNKGHNHKESGFCMVSNSEMYMSSFDCTRNAAWNAIKDLGGRLK